MDVNLHKMAVEDVEATVGTLRSLTQAVDELVKLRAAAEPYVLPSSTFLPNKTSPLLTDADIEAADWLPTRKTSSVLPAALARSKRGTGQPVPYAHARAAAVDAARSVTSAGAHNRLLSASKKPSLNTQLLQEPGSILVSTQKLGHVQQQQQQLQVPEQQVQGAYTGGTQHLPGSIQDIASKAQALLKLPGQLPYRQLLVAAKTSRAPELQAFTDEIDGLDAEIDAYLAADRYQRLAPSAALVLQCMWRARAPRKSFHRYMHLRHTAALGTLATHLWPWQQLVGAIAHYKRHLLAVCFNEWRSMGELKLLLFTKVLARLKASMMIDVRDSQSPNHLWRLCTVPGQDPWSAKIGLGALCRSLIHSQAPRRTLKRYFTAWRSAVALVNARRHQAAEVLTHMERSRTLDRLHNLFRFWYRWSMVKMSEKMKITPPLFRPRLDTWDTWLWEHMRSNELRGRVALLHRGFRLRHCFKFWRGFAARNTKLRTAWMGAVAPQIEALMRYALGCLKANWRVVKTQRRIRNSAFSEWLRITRRHMLVRNIAKQAEAISRTSIKKQAFRFMREWCNMSKLLNMGASVQMLQRRSLCMIPLCAWTGDHQHMWFIATWQAWRNHAVNRQRMRCFLSDHLHRVGYVTLELAFKAWRKVTQQQAEHHEWAEQERARREERQQQREAAAQQLKQSLSRTSSRAGHAHGPALSRSSSQAGALQLRLSQSTRSGMASHDSSQGGLQPRQSMGRDTASKQGLSRNVSLSSLLAAQQHGNRHEEDVEEEEEILDDLDDESVWVTCADYPAPTLWRPIIPFSTLMTQQDESYGINPAQVTRMIQQLGEVEGPFLPSNSTDDRQLVLEVMQRAEVSVSTRQLLHPDRKTQQGLWQSPGSAADPYIWQRLVGLMACNTQLHPEAPCGPLIDHSELPWACEVEHIRLKQAAARLRVPRNLGLHDSDKDSDDGVTQLNHLFGGSPEPRHAHPPPCQKHRRTDTDVDLPSFAGALTQDQQELMWLHRLAMCEQLLEGCAAALLQLGNKHLPLMYDQLHRTAVVAHQRSGTTCLALKQGDLLVRLLQGALQHDVSYMLAASQYRNNRDRVITMGLSLHQHAMALNRHCPEFTLLYPEYQPTDTWRQMVDAVDLEDPDAPTPERPSTPVAPTQEPSQPAPPQLSKEGKPATPPKGVRNSQVRGSILIKQGVMSTADRIKLEMLGISAPATPTTTAIKPATPPVAGAVGFKPGTPIAGVSPGASAAGARPISGQPTQTLNTAGQSVTGTDGGGVPAGDSNAASPGKVGGPLSLEEMQARGVVLGAAAAAILAAKAAAAKRSAVGHRVNAAQMAQMLSKTAPYKTAWRPSGYKRLAEKLKDKEPHSPKVKRLPPLPDFHHRPHTSHDGRDSWDVRLSSSAASTPSAAAAAAAAAAMAARSGGTAAGDAALQAMMHHAAAHQQPAQTGTDGQQQHVHLQQYSMVHRAQLSAAAASPPPPPPYMWFNAEGRLFPTVADIPQPDETPGMHELHHRANRLMVERLDNSMYSLPLMPAVIYSEWGNPVPMSHLRLSRHMRSAATSAGHSAAASPIRGPSPSLMVLNSMKGSMHSTAGGAADVADAASRSLLSRGSSNAANMKRQANFALPMSTVVEGGSTMVSPRDTESLPSLTASKKTRLTELGMPELLQHEEDKDAPQQAMYRSGLLGDMQGIALRESSGDGASASTGSDSAPSSRACTPPEGTARVVAQLRPASASLQTVQEAIHISSREGTPEPQFVATTAQLNIFLGGHMSHHRRRPQSRSSDLSTQDAQGAELEDAAKAGNVPDVDFDAVFSPARIVHTPSMQRRAMLQGYDLRTELMQLMGSETAAAGAETLLLGNRQLTAEEEANLQLELSRVEAELAKGARARRQYRSSKTGSSNQAARLQSPRHAYSSPGVAGSQRKSEATAIRSLDAVQAGSMAGSETPSSIVSPRHTGLAADDSERLTPRLTPVNAARSSQQLSEARSLPSSQAVAELLRSSQPSLLQAPFSGIVPALPAASPIAGLAPTVELSRKSAEGQSRGVQASTLVLSVRGQSGDISLSPRQPALRPTSTNKTSAGMSPAMALSTWSNADGTLGVGRPDSVSAWEPDADSHLPQVMPLSRSPSPGKAARLSQQESAAQRSITKRAQGASPTRAHRSPAAAVQLLNNSEAIAAQPANMSMQQPAQDDPQSPPLALLMADPLEMFPERPMTGVSIQGGTYAASDASSELASPSFGTALQRDALDREHVTAIGHRSSHLMRAVLDSTLDQIEFQSFQIAVYSSLGPADMTQHIASLPSALDVGSNDDSGFVLTHSSMGNAGNSTRPRRKSNLRTQQTTICAAASTNQLTDAAQIQPQVPPGLQPHGNMLAAVAVQYSPTIAAIPEVPEDMDEESAGELLALRAMWCSAPYTLQGSTLPHPSSEAADQVAQLFASAAEDEWQRYEAAASQLVEQLSNVLSQRDAIHDVGAGVPLDGHAGTNSEAAAALGHMAHVTRHSLSHEEMQSEGDVISVNRRQAGEMRAAAGGHQLHRALSLMERNIAAAIHPEKLTGFQVGSYSEELSDLISRLVVAPMATRYLFWKKVQSINLLKQKVLEDRTLETQLRAVAWSATFAPGHTIRPSGWQPDTSDATTTQQPHTTAPVAAYTGAPAGLVRPAGWSTGVLRSMTAPRVPWATPIPSAAFEPQPLVMPLHQPITLKARDDTPPGASKPLIELPLVGSAYGALPPAHVIAAAAAAAALMSSQRQQAALASSQQLSELPEVDLLDPLRPLQPQWQPPHQLSPTVTFRPQGQEALVQRLEALLELRRRTLAAAELRPPTPDTPLGFMRTHSARHDVTEPLLTGRSGYSSLHDFTIDQDEAQVEELTRLTIAVHKDTLARHHQRVGHASRTMLPGKGHMSGWAPPPNLPAGYSGRDGFQDTADPFTYPSRPRATAAPKPLPVITLKGAPALQVTTSRQHATDLSQWLGSAGMPVALNVRASRAPPAPAELSAHLPTPSSQLKPYPSLPPLSPVASPPATGRAEQQLGNMLFVTPHAKPYVSYETRLYDNAYLPGPHALGLRPVDMQRSAMSTASQQGMDADYQSRLATSNSATTGPWTVPGTGTTTPLPAPQLNVELSLAGAQYDDDHGVAEQVNS